MIETEQLHAGSTNFLSLYIGHEAVASYSYDIVA